MHKKMLHVHNKCLRKLMENVCCNWLNKRSSQPCSAVSLTLPTDERHIPTLRVAVFLRQIPSWDLL